MTARRKAVVQATSVAQRALTDRQRELLRLVQVRPDNVAVFASDERIPDWNALKSVMETLGGAWKRNKQGFEFAENLDAAELVRVALETGEILDPKLVDFFVTPRAFADEMVARAKIRAGDIVLEPSAGKGAIARAVRRACPSPLTPILCAELLPDFRSALRQDGFGIIGDDFLKVEPEAWPVDVVVANPPFSGQADIIHMEHALRFLRPGGRLVAIMSAGVMFRDNARTKRFRALVESLGGTFDPLPDGSFKASGTGVRTVMLVVPAVKGGPSC